MKKTGIFLLVLCLIVYGQALTDVKASSLDTASMQEAEPEVDPEATFPRTGKPFRAAGFSLLAGGILSLCVAAIFSAEYNNRQPMGDPIAQNDDLEKDEDLRTYALISVWTGLGLSATAIPFIIVGTKRKKHYDTFMDKKMYGLRDRSYFIDICIQF